jgi:hypothetical protein
MIRKLIDKLLGKAAPPAEPRSRIPLGQRVEVPAEVHGIDPALIDERAVKVVQTLQDGGHVAYIVGGAVRDLLVGLRPKDFDVATNATPEEVKALFRRAFIIGRRFRIVHVVFGAAAITRSSRSRPSAPRWTRRLPTRSAATRRPPAATWSASRTSSTPKGACCATTSGAR